MTQPGKLQFKAWQRSILFDAATDTNQGRLSSSLNLELSDEHGNNELAKVDFDLVTAGDVAALKANAIKHLAPAPYSQDAESTKFVHIEFWEKDLPWRYTPHENHSTTLRPWMVLLVGTGDEISVTNGIVQVQDSVLADHDLRISFCWAHSQSDGNLDIARIISPRVLLPQHEYLAVLVPAFNSSGLDMWAVDHNRHVTRDFGEANQLTAYFSWKFWTAEAGDFSTLAAALQINHSADVGKAKLRYRREVPAQSVDINLPLEIGGAINSRQSVATADPTILKAVIDDLDRLNNSVLDEHGTSVEVIGLPHYGRPWIAHPDEISTGWPQELNDDPRGRAVAGLGAWMGVVGQEKLIEAAVQQAGALREASQRINHLALGLWASRRIWDRRLPTDKNERLQIMGPLLSRIVSVDGGVALDRVTSGTSPLPAAIFSSAAQRILRDRGTHTRHLNDGGSGFKRSQALDYANQPEPLPEQAPDGLPHFDKIASQMGLPPLDSVLKLTNSPVAELMKRLWSIILTNVEEYQQRRKKLLRAGEPSRIRQLRQTHAKKLHDELQVQLNKETLSYDLTCLSKVITQSFWEKMSTNVEEYFARVLEEESLQRQLRDALWRAIRRCFAVKTCVGLIHGANPHHRFPASFCDELINLMPPPPLDSQRPIDLGALSDGLIKLLDPRQPDPPARRRICNRIEGIDCSRLVPPEFAIGINFPAWDLLREHDKEWLLPGVETLPKDSISALQTNPAFIDAYMVGLNSQFMAEMRWRDLAVDRKSTPLRMFWGQVDYATGQRIADINPLAEWAKATDKPLGDLTHQTIPPDDPNNKTGKRLVLVFRSDLFRRYPSTLVYLVKPNLADDVDDVLQQTPDFNLKGNDRSNRLFFGPIFIGRITPEVTFFIFDVSPDTLDQFWLVLDEPPSERRFRSDERDGKLSSDNSVAFAKSALDQPFRVAISGEELAKLETNQ